MRTERILKIVNTALEVDIAKETRIREYVYARFIYFKLMRDKGFSLAYIGQTLNKNHATVIHGLKQFEILKNYDDFKNMYDKVRLLLNKEERPFYFNHLNNCNFEIKRYKRNFEKVANN